MNHPEQGVERAQALDAHVEDHAHSEEARENQQREPQAAEEDEEDASHSKFPFRRPYRKSDEYTH